MRVTPLAPVLLVATIVPAGAHAQDRERFGDMGQLTLTASTQLLLGSFGSNSRDLGQDPRVSLGYTSRSGGSSMVELSAAGDYFVVDGLSLGAAVAYGRERDLWGVGAAARVGYDVPLSPELSVWARLDLAFDHWARGGDSVATLNRLTVGGYLPVLYHPVEHFFIGLGPTVARGIYAKSSDAAATAADELATSVGVQSVLGGWFSP